MARAQWRHRDAVLEDHPQAPLERAGPRGDPYGAAEPAPYQLPGSPLKGPAHQVVPLIGHFLTRKRKRRPFEEGSEKQEMKKAARSFSPQHLTKNGVKTRSLTF